MKATIEEARHAREHYKLDTTLWVFDIAERQYVNKPTEANWHILCILAQAIREHLSARMAKLHEFGRQM